MKTAGQKTVYLAFSQLMNLDRYYHCDFGKPSIEPYDVIAQFLQSLEESNVEVPNYAHFLQYFVNRAHKNAMRVALSFGGANASAQQFKILQKPTETYEGQAIRLYQFMQSFGIDKVDFDMETVDSISSQDIDPHGQSIVMFFQKLYDLLSVRNKQSILTITADLQWANRWLRPLFYDDSERPIFAQLFHGLNLMTYSDDRYWLDPSDCGWGIEQWIDVVGKENTGMLNIGFHDQVRYANTSANGGHHQHRIRPGSSNGQAAAQIYLQLQRKLFRDGYTTPLGIPFYWPSANVRPHGQDRYQVVENKSNFVSQEMQDFFDWLKSHQQSSKCWMRSTCN